MQTEKIITYLAMGVASLICLLFLLDLVAGIFGRNIAMDILLTLGGASCSGRESRRFSSSADRG